MHIFTLDLMESKNVTLKVNSKVYDEYRDYCKKKGIIISKQFENFMLEELEKLKNQEE